MFTIRLIILNKQHSFYYKSKPNSSLQQRKLERFVFTLENITHVVCDLKHLKEVIVICSSFVRENSRTYSNCLMDTLSTHHKHYVYLNIFGHHSLSRTL